MKRHYITPQTEQTVVTGAAGLMAGSVTGDTGGGSGIGDGGGGDPSGFAKRSLFDDTEEEVFEPDLWK